MNDLISRQDAIDAVKAREWLTQDGKEILEEVIEQLPSAQPERKKGKWRNGKCSECGEHAPFWCMASTYNESNYCPNCGADMRGE